MKDELFTMTPDMPAMSPEMLARWQEELRRNSLRMKHFSEMIMNPKEPEVGPTPREEIYRKGKSRLWRYASKRTGRANCRIDRGNVERGSRCWDHVNQSSSRRGN